MIFKQNNNDKKYTSQYYKNKKIWFSTLKKERKVNATTTSMLTKF